MAYSKINLCRLGCWFSYYIPRDILWRIQCSGKFSFQEYDHIICNWKTAQAKKVSKSTLVIADTFGTSFCVRNSESP